MSNQGLYEKYIVTNSETGQRVSDCFVLRPDRDPSAEHALLMYAAHTRNTTLADELRTWVGNLRSAPPSGEWWWCPHCERRYWDDFPNCIYCSANCDRWKGEGG